MSRRRHTKKRGLRIVLTCLFAAVFLFSAYMAISAMVGLKRADEATVELAAGYLKAVSGGDAAQLFRWCAVNEGMDGKSFSALCGEARLQLTDALCARRKLKGLSRKDMLRLCGLMEKLSQYQKVNTGVKQLFGLLAVDSIAGSEM